MTGPILQAPETYDRSRWQQILGRLRSLAEAAFRRGEDLELARGERLILKSPNGAAWAVSVDDTGQLGTTPL